MHGRPILPIYFFAQCSPFSPTIVAAFVWSFTKIGPSATNFRSENSEIGQAKEILFEVPSMSYDVKMVAMPHRAIHISFTPATEIAFFMEHRKIAFVPRAVIVLSRLPLFVSSSSYIGSTSNCLVL
jgi:hypothetical protein